MVTVLNPLPTTRRRPPPLLPPRRFPTLARNSKDPACANARGTIRTGSMKCSRHPLSGTGSSLLESTVLFSTEWHWHKPKGPITGPIGPIEMLGLLKLTCDGSGGWEVEHKTKDKTKKFKHVLEIHVRRDTDTESSKSQEEKHDAAGCFGVAADTVRKQVCVSKRVSSM